jgi:nucleoside-diphosphate-sugar epimerase
MKKIAITGSNGFIGKQLVPVLQSLGYNVTEISRSKGLDISDWDSVKELPKCDVIIHLAAKTFVPDSFDNPRVFYDVNQTVTTNAMELARLWQAKIIHMSSYFYGPPQYLPVDEKHSIHPHNPYAQTKLIAENIVLGYSRDFNLSGIIFRLFNIYGPNQDDSFLIPTILKQVKSGKVILKDPRPKRDFIHVRDVVDAIVTAVEKQFISVQIVNLGSGVSYSVEEIVNLFSIYSKSSFTIDYTNEYRKGEVLDSLSSNAKILDVLGWQAKISIENGISDLLRSESV